MVKHPVTGSTLTPTTGNGWMRLSHAQARVYWTMVGQEILAREESKKEDANADTDGG